MGLIVASTGSGLFSVVSSPDSVSSVLLVSSDDSTFSAGDWSVVSLLLLYLRFGVPLLVFQREVHHKEPSLLGWGRLPFAQPIPVSMPSGRVKPAAFDGL